MKAETVCVQMALRSEIHRHADVSGVKFRRAKTYLMVGKNRKSRRKAIG